MQCLAARQVRYMIVARNAMSATPAFQSAPPVSSTPKLKRTIQALAMLGLLTAAVFGSAGRIDWIRGWICLIAYILAMSTAAALIKLKNPALLEARANWRHKDTKSFDKIFLAIYLPLIFIQPALAGLDAVRFRWSSMPFATVYAGIALYVIATAIIGWTMTVNPFAESTVRIQTDRGHKTVTTGPYRIVRHPMYVGAISMYIGAPLIFGSLWALVAGGLIAALFIWRTAMEDRTLRRELPEYEQFAAVTRYRLLPGVW